MKNKYIYTVTICFISVALFCAFLNIYGALKVGTVFQESLLAIASVGIFLIGSAYFGMKLFALYEKIAIIFLALSLTFNFAVFGPIFIDRSISYHMVMLVSENGKIKTKNLKEVVFTQMLDKRVSELTQANLIQLDEQGNIISTPRGNLMTKVLELLGYMTGTLGEFKQANDALQE